MVGLQVKVDTTASAVKIWVNEKVVSLDGQRRGKTKVRENATCALFWLLIGTPGTKYKITLKPESGTLKMAGKHPIELRIPQGASMGSGSRRFQVSL